MLKEQEWDIDEGNEDLPNDNLKTFSDTRKQKRYNRKNNEELDFNRIIEYWYGERFSKLSFFFQQYISNIISENNFRYNTDRGKNIREAFDFCENAEFYAQHGRHKENILWYNQTEVEVFVSWYKDEILRLYDAHREIKREALESFEQLFPSIKGKIKIGDTGVSIDIWDGEILFFPHVSVWDMLKSSSMTSQIFQKNPTFLDAREKYQTRWNIYSIEMFQKFFDILGEDFSDRNIEDWYFRSHQEGISSFFIQVCDMSPDASYWISSEFDFETSWTMLASGWGTVRMSKIHKDSTIASF